MQRFKAALPTGNWPDNPEDLVRDNNGAYVLYEDVKKPEVDEQKKRFAKQLYDMVVDKSEASMTVCLGCGHSAKYGEELQHEECCYIGEAQIYLESLEGE